MQQLDLSNEEAVAYLQGRLQRAGVEVALAEAGARPGEDVEIGGTVFTFRPEDWVGDEDDVDDWVDLPDGPQLYEVDPEEGWEEGSGR